MSIYCIQDSGGKKYIGQTRRTPEIRFREHKACAAAGKEGPLYDALRAGECFLSLITECEPEKLNRLERKFIRKEKTLFPDGFNVTPGGRQTRRQCKFWAKRKRELISH